jgi:hypothetical protein
MNGKCETYTDAYIVIAIIATTELFELYTQFYLASSLD